MSRIFITGDIHGNPQNRFSSFDFPVGKELTKEDYVIILGDFGIVWDHTGESKSEAYWLDWLEGKPWTTLFIDGNHENFDRLEAYPVEEWHGGKAHFIRPSVIHLMRGEIFDVAGKKILAMGGAASHDIQDGILEPTDPDFKKKYSEMIKNPFCLFRVNKVSWWAQEVPSTAERLNALNNLEKVNNTIDIVLSHEGPVDYTRVIGFSGKPHEYSEFLTELKNCINFDKWFFGHYHVNRSVGTEAKCLYEDILEIYSDADNERFREANDCWMIAKRDEISEKYEKI